MQFREPDHTTTPPPPPPPPKIVPQITTFSATPTDVNSGQTSTITWATTNAAAITISPAVPQSDDAGPLPDLRQLRRPHHRNHHLHAYGDLF